MACRLPEMESFALEGRVQVRAAPMAWFVVECDALDDAVRREAT